jgi:hypothetical protein
MRETYFWSTADGWWFGEPSYDGRERVLRGVREVDDDESNVSINLLSYRGPFPSYDDAVSKWGKGDHGLAA